MATYVPNAQDPTQPTGDKSVASAAPEFRTLKTFVDAVYTAQVNFQAQLTALQSAIGAGTNSVALAANLGNTTDPDEGDVLIGVKRTLAGIAATNLHNWIQRRDVYVSESMTDQQVTDMQAGIVKPDIYAAAMAAIASFPRQGSPNWQPWKLIFPRGVCTTSATISILNQQGGEIHMGGCQIEGNFDGPILQVGDSSGSNDCLRFHIYGGTLIQSNTGVNARAFKGTHLYSCSINAGYFFGGRISFELDGNANLINACAFRFGSVSNVKTGAASNNEANTFLVCSSELSAGVGYDLGVVSGAGGFTHILGGYIENNTGGGISAANNQKTVIDGVYFNLQNNASAIKLGGTVGASYQDPQVIVRNCRVLGGTTAKFIEELSSSSINCRYSGNTLESGTCDMYGSAPKSINDARRRDRVYISNADTFTGASGATPPTGWTASAGGGAFSVVSPISQYGSGGALQIATSTAYCYQQLSTPANALLRISAWGATSNNTDATVVLYNTARDTIYGSAQSNSSTSGRIEFYVPSSARANATAIVLALRNLTGTGNAQFDNIVIEDMTN